MAPDDEMESLRARTHGETDNPNLVVFALFVAAMVGLLLLACQ